MAPTNHNPFKVFRQARLALWIAALLLLSATGCVSFLNSKKAADPGPQADSQKLVKPVIPDDKYGAEGSDRPREFDESGSAADQRLAAKGAEKPRTDAPESSDGPGSNAKGDSQKSARSSGDKGDDSDSRLTGVFDVEKHDHAAYSAKIKNEAIRLVNRTDVCSIARLCRDKITEDWTVSLYVKRPKTFRFVTYAWDPVDQKWEKVFESQPEPLKRLKRHLQFISAGKDCSYLKGRGP